MQKENRTENSTAELLQRTKAAWGSIRDLPEEEKNKLLRSMADSLEKNTEKILEANQSDMKKAEGKISSVMLDRLNLNESRVHGMAEGIRAIAALPSHTGRVLAEVRRPNGLVIRKVQVPFGLVAIIYESRPNVTSDAAALTLKSSNTCILRSGKEAWNSSKAVVDAMKEGITEAGGDPDIINLITDTSRESAAEIMQASGVVDLLIPRGGAGLIRNCVENAKVPVIQTGTGICHVYVDREADFEKALNIIVNAKTSRPSVCNAEEVLLVQEAAAEEFLPKLKAALVDRRRAEGLLPVELRLDEKAQKLIPGTPAGEKDFDTEFLDYILAVKIVADVKEAVRHIGLHSTGHSDAIITENAQTAEYFVHEVDSAAVYVNASTRFTDGGEFGLGCEMGISTQKLHGRGPLGLDELSTYKYVITGNGQVR